MPNGHDKNWVRLCGAIDGFRLRYDRWPKRVRMYEASLRDFDFLFRPEDIDTIKSKVELFSDEAGMIAEDESGAQYNYGEEGFPKVSPDVRAREWLGVSPKSHDDLGLPPDVVITREDEVNRLHRLGPYALTEQFDGALLFAAKLHRQQPRKGTRIPYLGHLLAVAALVIEDGGSEDEAVAALLHDSLEDQGNDYPGGRAALRVCIRDQFGPGVAAIVDACTDDEELAKGLAATPEEERERWLERKWKYAESIAHKTPQALRVTTADKVHNAESILDSHGVDGAEVWMRFRTKSRQDQVDVYRSLYEAIKARNEEFPAIEKSYLPRRLLRAVDLMKLLS